MPMNSELLAQEMLVAIGGEVTAQRNEAFRKLAQAIINHIKVNMVVTAAGTDTHGDAVTTISTLIL